MNHTSNKRRRGYVLVLVAMLLFGLMAVAALVIDLGFARLTHQQMRTASDSAALEGLRGEGDSDLTYTDRQDSAEELVGWSFDDDLNPSNGDARNFGAGPQVEFVGGAGNAGLNASQLIQIDPNAPTYKPSMQRGAVTPEAFSVTLQRGGTNPPSSNLFSQGPSVPFMFGRGSSIDRGFVGNGITVRSESTARGVPALSVGLAVLDETNSEVYPGAVAIGYQLADWNGTRTNPQIITTARTEVGQEVDVSGPATTALPDGYCCIFADFSGSNRVVGFGMIQDGNARQRYVSIANASADLGLIWSSLDPSIRDQVRNQNNDIDGGLLVAVNR